MGKQAESGAGMDAGEYDVTINIHKGQNGYGIYFTQKDDGIQVTKLDDNSEAVKAGVQPGDLLVAVEDNQKKLPVDNPGSLVKVSKLNYHSVLEMVRGMTYCKLYFKAAPAQGFD